MQKKKRQKKKRTLTELFRISLGVSMILISSACTPRVEIAAPEKPITINLNVKIDHEVRIRVEKDLDELISEDSELF